MQFPLFRWLLPCQTRPRHVHLPDGVRLAAGAGREHLLARALYRVRRIDFGALPRREHAGFLSVQLAAWQLFAHTMHAVVLDARGAIAFAWDAESFAARCAAAGLDAARAVVLPETLVHAPMAGEGARLLPCLTGWEAQVWRHGALQQSRWWPVRPEEAQWQNFLRGASLPAAPLPELAEPDRAALFEVLSQSRAWARPRPPAAFSALPSRVGYIATATLLWLMALASVVLGRQWWAAWERLEALKREQADRLAQARPIVAAREEALANLAQLQFLIEMVQRPQPLELMADVKKALPKQQMVIRELEWSAAQLPAQLRLALELPPGSQRVTFVRALETAGWLSEVREEAPEGGAEQGLLVLKALATNSLPGGGRGAP